MIDHGPVFENTINSIMDYVCFLNDPTDFKGIITENTLFVFQTDEWTLTHVILQTVIIE